MPSDAIPHTMQEVNEPPAKRVKLTELPISASQRSAITNILHSYKKKGSFDTLRKSVYAAYDSSPAKASLHNALTKFGEEEIERNPKLLAKDRRQAAPLIEGAAERKGVYKSTEEEVAQLINKLLGNAASELHEIRRLDIGDEAANEEVRNGLRSDDAYAAEADQRRKARAKAKDLELRAERQKELEALRRREEELKRQREEDEKRAKELEEKRRRAEELKRQREKEMHERIERKRRQDAEWAAEQCAREEKERERREREREKDIEAAAMEELLREGKQAAARSAKASKDTPTSSSRKDASTPIASRGSAIEAIMRREKLENQRKRSEDEGDGSTSDLERGDANKPRKQQSDDIPFASSPDHGFDARQSESSRPDSRNGFYHPSSHTRERDRPRRYEDDYSRSSYKRHSGGKEQRHSRNDHDHDQQYSRDQDRRHISRHERGDRGYEDDGYARHHHSSSRFHQRPRSRGDYDSERHSHKHSSHVRKREYDDPRRRSRSPRQAAPHPKPDSRHEHSDKNGPAEIDRYVPSTSARASNPNHSAKNKIYDKAAHDEKDSRVRTRSVSRSRARRNHSRHRSRSRGRR